VTLQSYLCLPYMTLWRGEGNCIFNFYSVGKCAILPDILGLRSVASSFDHPNDPYG